MWQQQNDCNTTGVYFVYIISSIHHTIVHFTVACLVSWPLSGSEAGVDLVLIDPPAFHM